MIRTMNMRDINQVVAVHISSFPDFFLSFLGSRFLFLFYSGICSDPDGIAFVYMNESRIPVGFVAGTLNPQGFYSRLLKRDWLKFAFASITPTLRKPSTIWRVARAVFHPSNNPLGDDVAGLFSICMLPELQGQGAGTKLVRAFLDEAKQRGCRRIVLTTDRDNNDAVNAFYTKLGFAIERQYATPDGRRMNEYWTSLPEEMP